MLKKIVLLLLVSMCLLCGCSLSSDNIDVSNEFNIDELEFKYGKTSYNWNELCKSEVPTNSFVTVINNNEKMDAILIRSEKYTSPELKLNSDVIRILLPLKEN